MQHKSLSIDYTIYNSIQELPNSLQKLLEEAKVALTRAYAPYSNFSVGAALLLENGEIITGNNQENAAYPLGLCAERVAIFAAGSQYPDIPIQKLAITVKSANQVLSTPIAPCGGCRQVIAESEYRFDTPIQIILQGETGRVFVFESIQTLLPFSFDGSFL